MTDSALSFQKPSLLNHRLLFAAILAAMLLGLDGRLQAAVVTWTGGSASSDNWSTGANWDSGTAPANNDSLVFNAAVGAGQITNNLVGRTFAQISFIGVGSSFFVHGNSITLTGGISQSSSGGANTFHPDITLATNPQNFAVTGAGVGSGLQITGDINLNGRNLTVNVTDAGTELILSGGISGTGNITRGTGAGGLRFSGSTANTFAGTTTINGGYIFAIKPNGVTSIPGDIVIGNGVGVDTLLMGTDDQFGAASDVTLHDGGVFDNNNETNIIASLTFDDGGRVETTTGRLELGGSVNVIGSGVSNAIINGNLHLGSATRTFNIADTAGQSIDLDINGVISGGFSGGFPSFAAGLIKSGAGLMRVNAANTYSGPTTVNAGQLTVNNNLGLGGTGNVFGGSGTVVNSNAVLLLNNAHITNEVLTLNGTNPDGALQNNATADWAGSIVLGANTFIEASSDFGIDGEISGTGGFTKIGTGTLTLYGATGNTYGGDTFVNEGELFLDKSSGTAISSGTLTIGDGLGGANVDIVRELASFQIGSIPIVVNSSGLLDLNGFSDTVGALTLNGGDVQTGAGTISPGDITVAGVGILGPNSSITGNLNIGSGTHTFTVNQGSTFPFNSTELAISAIVSGSASIIKDGNGEMSLSSANTFSGTMTVNAGTLILSDSLALGTTAGGTTVNSNASLRVFSDIAVGAEALTLNSSSATTLSSNDTNSWSGAVTLDATASINVDTNSSLILSGIISGTGGVTKIGPGVLIYDGLFSNGYSGLTTVNEGSLELSKVNDITAVRGDLTIGDGIGGTNADVVRLQASSQINNNSDVIINSSGLLNMPFQNEGIGSLSGSGNIQLDLAGDLTNGYNHASTTFSGTIIGPAGALSKVGNGIFTLSGNNTYGGLTHVESGTLIVNGLQSQSDVRLLAAGTLGGSGTVGDINNAAGGTVSPGTSPGILGSSNVLFGAAADFNIEINGTDPGTSYDRLSVRGTNTLGGALNVTVGGGYAPTVGQTFLILANDGAETVTGTFAGLPNNSIVTSGIHKFVINYANDVTLTYTNPALSALVPQLGGGNGNSVIDPNECNNLNLVITNVSGVALTGISAVLSTTNSGVVITQPDSAYPNIGINGRGTNTTPFQISTLPSYVCGETVDLKLTITTDGGNLITTFSLPSGSPGSPVRFNNNVNLGIVDSGSITSSIAVVGITTPIKKVTVSLHLSHFSDEDLDISLVSPDGTTINLSSDNGGTGDDFGTDCVLDATRTTFDDAAGTAITAGVAPFAGTFRPEQQLSAFIGKEGVDLNGTWKLVITDDSPGSAGTLRCWSLFVSPTACVPGGGGCDTCPGVFTGSITTNDLERIDRIERVNTPSTCAVPKGCSTYPVEGPYNYDTYTFTNTGGAACVTVTLDTPCTNAVSAEAYLNSHNPANLCATYLAD
ncbi:MAG: autotransporter-associated beta strand repeat-containing protein, partial [Akkermansiaceae bacterium]|nr:autotransporter-associated beta strand repeat-containing protein [Verrucomicrobiales bacterium]